MGDVQAIAEWGAAGIFVLVVLQMINALPQVLSLLKGKRRDSGRPPPVDLSAALEPIDRKVNDVHEAIGARRGRRSELEDYLRTLKDCQKTALVHDDRQTKILEGLADEQRLQREAIERMNRRLERVARAGPSSEDPQG